MEVGEVFPCTDQSSSSWSLHPDHIIFKTGLPLSLSGEILWVCQMWGCSDPSCPDWSISAVFMCFNAHALWRQWNVLKHSTAVMQYCTVIGWWDIRPYYLYVIGTCQSLTVRLYKQLYLTAPAFCFFGVGKVGCVLSVPSSWCEHRWFSMVCCSIDALSIFRCWHLGFVVGHFCLLVVIYRFAYAWMGWYILTSGLLWYWCTSHFRVLVSWLWGESFLVVV